ncbi:histidine kinase dimerization/phosphoacceptor domain -containing protein [Methanococcoides methylutens]|uniref:histidine kinase dimerization/phosphoacceptor domain -containing protein n=1 Tax=Methanococcoides methylutens TaxID=2226 RepID=UPI001E396187|nr:histidine kinase dimerization/phosphoacceptor domain -containing protein [Methanococcoides methylutens]
MLSLSAIVTISTVTDQQEEMAYKQSIEMTRNYANYFDGNTRTNQGIVKTISTTLSNYENADRDEVNEILKDLLLENPQLVGVYVGYEPNAFDGRDAEFIGEEGHDETGRFVPYWNRIDGQISVEPLVNYETSEYYQGPKELKQTVATEPYLYQGILVVSYDSPIIINDEFVGIAGVDVSLNYFDEVVSEVFVFENGYAFVTSNSGKLLTHPEHKEWIGTKTLDDFGVAEISEMATDIRDGKNGYIETVDPATGREVVMFYEPITEGTYSFVLCAPKDEMLAGVAILRNRLLFMSGFSIILVGGVAYMISRSTDHSIKKMLNDFKVISDNALNGNFDTRADTNVQVDFKKIPVGLNHILDNMSKLTNSNERSMAALQRSESKFRLFFNNSNEPTIIYDTNCNILEVNEVACEFTGYSRDEMLNMKIIDMDSSQDASKVSDMIKKLPEVGTITFESTTACKDGTLIPIEISNRIIEYAGKPAVLSTSRDLTERKNAEKALIENEAMRKKEIHHRIKNNLQIICSLLDLCAMDFDDSSVVQAFMESRGRVVSISLIHEELYQSTDMESINFADYVRKLSDELISSYSVDKDVELKLNVEDIFLGMDIAIPLGIIINEMVTNSLKHAFPEKSGQICIELHHPDENECVLIVSDDGIGFPEEINYRNSTTLGLQLLNTLVDQIGGTITMDSTSGTAFSIVFNKV